LIRQKFVAKTLEDSGKYMGSTSERKQKPNLFQMKFRFASLGFLMIIWIQKPPSHKPSKTLKPTPAAMPKGNSPGLSATLKCAGSCPKMLMES